MNKIKNNSIVFALKMLSLFAFGVLITPAIASADMPGYVTPYNSTSFNNNVALSNNNYNNYQQSVYTYNNPPVYNPAPVQTSSEIPTVYSGSTVKTKTVSKAKTTKAIASTTDNKISSLAANALFGSGGFLPSGLIQWLIIAIIILVLMILARRAFGGKQNYDASPMKHA